jgi:hypothetical protein
MSNLYPYNQQKQQNNNNRNEKNNGLKGTQSAARTNEDDNLENSIAEAVAAAHSHESTAMD